MTGVSSDWAGPSEDAEALAGFFVSNTDPSYISHGEILCGRAVDPTTWVTNLREVVCEEFTGILAGHKPDSRVAIARHEGALVGLAIVAFDGDRAVLEDMVIASDLRGRGLGREFLSGLEALLREQGVRVVLLESGIHNAGAHAFFHREGFDTVSVTMLKELNP